MKLDANMQREPIPGEAWNSAFDAWDEEDIKASRVKETWLSKSMRKLGKLAGLKRPIDEADYKALLERYGSDEGIKRHWLPNNVYIAATTKMRNFEKISIDVYTLIKDGSIPFLLSVSSIYFLIISSVFSFFAVVVGECYVTNAANFLPKGFLLISGLGHGVEQTDSCLWIETFGILIGVYLSLPIIGAIVLVRLLGKFEEL